MKEIEENEWFKLIGKNTVEIVKVRFNIAKQEFVIVES